MGHGVLFSLSCSPPRPFPVEECLGFKSCLGVGDVSAMTPCQKWEYNIGFFMSSLHFASGPREQHLHKALC